MPQTSLCWNFHCRCVAIWGCLIIPHLGVLKHVGASVEPGCYQFLLQSLLVTCLQKSKPEPPGQFKTFIKQLEWSRAGAGSVPGRAGWGGTGLGLYFRLLRAGRDCRSCADGCAQISSESFALLGPSPLLKGESQLFCSKPSHLLAGCSSPEGTHFLGYIISQIFLIVVTACLGCG